MPESPDPRRPALKKGMLVEVRNRFDGSWTAGFEIASVLADGYRLLRLSDREVLPARFSTDDVRRERKRQLWWV